MAAEYPLLYVTNSKNLRRERVVNPGGKKTDFFADRDNELAAHKARISSEIQQVQAVLHQSAQRFCSSGFVKVTLQEKAWAKTHRPVKRLFTPDENPVVGNSDIGELIVKVSATSLERVRSDVDGIEPETRRKRDRRGRIVLDTTRARSEVGAIEQLSLWSVGDRSVPDARLAIEVFEEHRLAPMYSVQLFESVASLAAQGVPRVKGDSPAASFLKTVRELGQKIGVYLVFGDEEGLVPSVYVGLTDSPGFAIIRGAKDLKLVSEHLREDGSLNPSDHLQLLELLGAHPNVRRVSVPTVFAIDKQAGFTESALGEQRLRRGQSDAPALVPLNLPAPQQGQAYPMVAIVDGGISAQFKDWVVGRYTEIDEDHRDLTHGSNIAGLLVGADSFNGQYMGRLEQDGCWLIDIVMQPDKDNVHAGDYYANGSGQFLDRLETIVAHVRQEHGVRVFNFSLNNQIMVSTRQFSEEATRLDEIARKHDVFFVISAGNARENDARPEWDRRPSYAAAQLIESKMDTLYGPADSLLNISVGATNGHGVPGCLPDAPARYSRRGPGVRGSIKPDVCQIGGAAGDGESTGLHTTNKVGNRVSVQGTSYATPLVAKTLAMLDAELEGTAPREVLLAMLLHSAHLKAPLSGRSVKRYARNLVGFGFPASSEDILTLDRHTFGVVVADSLHIKENTIIDFKWPRAMVGPDGSCRGNARLTLVYSPPVDFRYGAEAARIMLEPSLRQATLGPVNNEDEDEEQLVDGKTRYVSRVKPVHSYGLKRTSREASLLVDGLKWSPVKVLEGQLKGVGQSSDWRLTVNYIARDQAEFPEEGIAFAAILTISDPEKQADVYDELRQELIAGSALQLNDIRTALRIRPRG
ncbi:S8 family peptidase [Cupriavidus sp. 30B13]|uniref:S8 family peptidase n=1 Tax=Cupriavidus sp. 30B13 TaxID=3384241 RepID=UPI003B8FF878